MCVHDVCKGVCVWVGLLVERYHSMLLIFAAIAYDGLCAEFNPCCSCFECLHYLFQQAVSTRLRVCQYVSSPPAKTPTAGSKSVQKLGRETLGRYVYTETYLDV